MIWDVDSLERDVPTIRVLFVTQTYIHTCRALFTTTKRTFHILNLRYCRYYMRQPLQFLSLILPLKRPRNAKALIWFRILFHSWFSLKAITSSLYLTVLRFAHSNNRLLLRHSILYIYILGKTDLQISNLVTKPVPETLCAIWYLTTIKKMLKQPWQRVTFRKVLGLSLQIYCNRTPPWMFFTILICANGTKLRKASHMHSSLNIQSYQYSGKEERWRNTTRSAQIQ